MRRFLPAALFIATFGATAIFAVQEYYGISRSIRALGMGGAFYGLSDDEAALFYNPAGLSLYPGRAQLMVNLNSHISHSSLSAMNTISNVAGASGDLGAITTELESLQGKPIFVGAGVMPYFIARGFAIGMLAADAKADFALLGSGVDSDLDVTAISDSGLFVGFAGSLFHPNLHFGMTLKGMFRAGGQKTFSPVDLLTADNLQFEDLGGAGAGVDADLGMTYLFPSKGSRTAGVSLSLNNVLASNFSIARVEGPPPALVRTASAGGFVEWRFKRAVNYLRLMLDFAEVGLGGESDADRGARGGSVFKHLNLGLEMPLWGFLYLRTGVHQGNLTGGLGISAYAMKLDLATYAEELMSGVGRLTSRRWALRFALGFGAPSASPSGRGSRRRK